jgi:nicotinamidase/pyrazinamidase
MINPKFYDENKVGTLYPSNMVNVSLEAKQLQVNPSSKDTSRDALLLIDFQVDFCHQNGSLYVPGAEDDIRRTCNFIFNNFESITSISASLDSHVTYQIFHPSWWRDSDNKHPDPFTMITLDDINTGKFRPLIDPVGSIEYVKNLESQGNQSLVIWPYHTLIGSTGHILDPMLFEVLMYHGISRKSQVSFLQKGSIPQTEMYGILSPEVKIPSHPMGGFNVNFLKMLTNHDRVFIAGEAKSHCVLESIRQIQSYFKDDVDTLNKIYILEDCMSSVQHPDVDFDAIANDAFDKFRNSGINIIKSTNTI